MIDLNNTTNIPLEIITEETLPERILEILEDSKDIDKKVEDKYLKQYSNNEIYNRDDLSVEYNNMDRESKFYALKDLGYKDEVINDMINNDVVGLNAYIVGCQNKLIDNVSLKFNLQQEYNSDKISSLVFEGKTISKENVSILKKELNEAKEEYDKAVTLANEIIDKANMIKKEYEEIVSRIKTNSGEEPINWKKEEKKEYNEITLKYNLAVNDAKEMASKVIKEKNNYEKKKEAYIKIKEEYRIEVNQDLNVLAA